MYMKPKPLTPPPLPIFGSSFERPSGNIHFRKTQPQKYGHLFVTNLHLCQNGSQERVSAVINPLCPYLGDLKSRKPPYWRLPSPIQCKIRKRIGNYYFSEFLDLFLISPSTRPCWPWGRRTKVGIGM